MGTGNNAHFMPDAVVAKNAAVNLFLILDTEDEDQIQMREESSMLKEGINGDIEFRASASSTRVKVKNFSTDSA